MENLINIKIIDYGMGNIQSVKNAFELLNSKVEIISDPSNIKNADGIILPGVGAFSNAVKNLKERKLIEPLKEAVINNKVPLLGICLGMQLLADKSEERGNNDGLSFISGEIRKIPHKEGLRLPHVGWNEVTIKKKEPLFKNIIDKGSFYFVHSYRFECDDEFVVATTDYGQKINAVVRKENIFGIQFHPERSQRKGLHMLANFISYIKDTKV
jgi:imidazole glycerol-phosphate synthase subunit HisH